MSIEELTVEMEEKHRLIDSINEKISTLEGKFEFLCGHEKEREQWSKLKSEQSEATGELASIVNGIQMKEREREKQEKQ